MRCVLGANGREYLLVELQVVLAYEWIVSVGTRPRANCLFHFVVSTKQAQRSVVSYSLYVIDSLSAELSLKFGSHPYVSAGNHKVLPNDKTVFVAKLVEIIARIEGSTPYSYTVEVGKNADFVIAVVHWGTEYSTVLEKAQLTTGKD